MLQFHTRYAISHIDSSNGLFQEKSKHGPRVQYIHGISTPLPFLGVLKKNFLGWNFLGSWFLTLQFPISKLWQTILQNYFQGWKLAFSRISKGKVTNLKFPEWGVSENYTYPPTPHLFFFFFSGIAQWTGEFHPKSQITIAAWQLELLQKKFQTGGEGWGLEIF